MCAGRNLSATHTAFASARVMGTIGLMGQAVGTAATLAVEKHVNPRGIYTDKTLLRELQRQSMDDDFFLPGFKREISPLSRQAKLTCEYGDCSDLLNGVDRSFSFPRTVLKSFRIETMDSHGVWQQAYETKGNHQRLIRGKIGPECWPPVLCRYPPGAASV